MAFWNGVAVVLIVGGLIITTYFVVYAWGRQRTGTLLGWGDESTEHLTSICNAVVFSLANQRNITVRWSTKPQWVLEDHEGCAHCTATWILSNGHTIRFAVSRGLLFCSIDSFIRGEPAIPLNDPLL